MKRAMLGVGLFSVTLALVAGARPALARSPAECEALTSLGLEDTQITSS